MIKSNVYLIRCEHFIKIGVASNIKTRMGGLNGSNPFDINLVDFWPMPNKDSALMVECLSHKVLKNKGRHHKLEWFKKTTDKEAVEIIKESIERLAHPIKKEEIKSRVKIMPLRKISEKEYSIKSNLSQKKPVLTLEKIIKIISPMNLKAVAKESGVSYNAIYRLANGKTQPKYETVQKVAFWLESQQ